MDDGVLASIFFLESSSLRYFTDYLHNSAHRATFNFTQGQQCQTRGIAGWTFMLKCCGASFSERFTFGTFRHSKLAVPV